jgi:hypothetical protein
VLLGGIVANGVVSGWCRGAGGVSARKMGCLFRFPPKGASLDAFAKKCGGGN